ncbi:MAG: cytochrome c3 family protein [Desulfuromonadales bacterium]|nr:cytochrome c3 family protein [Desulfuromonadales bacterium]
MVFVRILSFVLLSLAALSLPVAAAESCLTAGCHADYAGMASPHPPVADENCLYCHVQNRPEHPAAEGASFELITQGAALCFLCHESMGGSEVHAPVVEGECLSCHQVHGGDNPFLLAVGDDRSALCFECHDETPFTRSFRHGPVAVGACTSCHSPHASDHQALMKKPVRDSCLGCHDDFAGEMAAASFIHPPVQNALCTDCHDPHSSDFRFSLKQEMTDLCFACHPEIGERAATAKVKHQPMTQAGSCADCHSTHFSQEHGLLSLPEQDLCLTCHGADSPLQDIEKQVSGEKNLHGPLREGQCGDCHNPHGSDYYRLLKGSYPEGRYAPYREGTYDLCLGCHEENLLRFADTTLYTNFRNGDLNLHFVHVADVSKGRTCRLCHEPHASVGEKLINREGMPFGNWKVPIGFEATETGGSCAPGCHQEVRYDRESPVDNNFQSFTE